MLVDLAVGAPRPRIRLPVSIPEDRPVAAAVPTKAADSVTRPFRKVCSTLEAYSAIHLPVPSAPGQHALDGLYSPAPLGMACVVSCLCPALLRTNIDIHLLLRLVMTGKFALRQ